MKIRLLLMLLCIALTIATSFAQSSEMAAIYGKQATVQIQLNGNPMVWGTNKYSVVINKWTGEFFINIPVNNLNPSIVNDDFKPTGENKDKNISIEGVICVDQVINGGDAILELPIESDIIFNDIRLKANIKFNIIKNFPNGFMVEADFILPHKYFNIEELNKAEEDVNVTLYFSGL